MSFDRAELLFRAYKKAEEVRRLKYETTIEDIQAMYVRGEIDEKELDAKLEAKFKVDEWGWS